MENEITTNFETVRCVPYQLCPKCGGEGRVDNFNLNTTGNLHLACDVCNGAKIIPMHIINQ